MGAGIAGLLIGTLLSRSGADVLVVDRHDAGGVATRNTTAKVTALQGTRYSDITSSRNADVAAEYCAAQLDAVGGLRRLINDLALECAVTEASAVTYATETDSADRVSREHAAARAAGLPVQWAHETELPFAVTAALALEDQFHMDPGALCHGLAMALGPERVAERTPVRDVTENDDACSVILESGTRITAQHVVIATQGPIVDPALLANRCTPMQSYALAARLPSSVPAGMYLSCDRSTRSLRPATINGDTVAIVGGAGHHMGEEHAGPERWATLAAWTEEHFGTAEITHRWATHDLVTTDHVPFVGRLGPTSHRLWVATGFAKWGMTNGYVAAHLISTMIGGGVVPWATTFDSTRIAATLNRNALSVAKTAATHLVASRVTHRHSPRCTHQGCVLRRDDALGTWDCPCHGSRFEANGDVIQGPANRPLS